MRKHLVFFSLLMCIASAASAQLSIGIRAPHVSIGINVPVFPHLVPVPGYPVYYAQDLNSNFFFYDGLYWVYVDDNWYSSEWYNGPWDLVEPEYVPLFILRVPVRYYRQPPRYFLGWRADAAPRWNDHWGNGWAEHHRGWDRWDRRSVPRAAPLPTYQRRYSGDRYPRQVEHQQQLRNSNYRYQPREEVTRQHCQAPRSPDSSRDVRNETRTERRNDVRDRRDQQPQRDNRQVAPDRAPQQAADQSSSRREREAPPPANAQWNSNSQREEKAREQRSQRGEEDHREGREERQNDNEGKRDRGRGRDRD